ncbi:MAG TPA: hypothetical protein VFZ75_07300 [Actinomycetota bacterium]|nr:hypothetical protein [Actinomycetota bacterium]
METASTSTGRLLAFRIVGWFLGVLTIGYSVYFTVDSILSSDFTTQSHRFHNLGGFAGGGLIGVFAIMFVLRPAWTAVWYALVAQAFAWLFGGLMGGDFVSGLLFVAPLGVVVLAVLHPDPRSLHRLPGRPSVALLTYALLGTIPAWIYAVINAELQRGPATDPHVEFHHWSGVAVSALCIAGAALATSLRGAGWQVTGAVTAVAAVLFGVAGLVFADYPGAPSEVGWSWLAIAAGIGFWILVQVESAREATSA